METFHWKENLLNSKLNRICEFEGIGITILIFLLILKIWTENIFSKYSRKNLLLYLTIAIWINRFCCFAQSFVCSIGSLSASRSCRTSCINRTSDHVCISVITRQQVRVEPSCATQSSIRRNSATNSSCLFINQCSEMSKWTEIVIMLRKNCSQQFKLQLFAPSVW